jgi:threonyl-tRNA synthetase
VAALRGERIFVELLGDGTLNKRVREAQLADFNYIIVVVSSALNAMTHSG